MNPLLIKQTSILSAILGGILGVLTLIPFLGGFSFFFLIIFLSAVIIIYMKKNDLIGIIDTRDGAILGAIIGFVSFIAFAVVFVPIAAILGSFLKIYSYLGWLAMLFNTAGFFVLIMLIIFMGLFSALMNAFSGMATAYLYETLSGVKKEEKEEEQIDFEIKE